MPKLANVGLLILFITTLFGIAGVQLFQGALLYRCYTPDAASASALPMGGSEDPGVVCSDDGTVGSQGTCEPGLSCLYYGRNPFEGTVGFDHITLALMTTFQVGAHADAAHTIVRGSATATQERDGDAVACAA